MYMDNMKNSYIIYSMNLIKNLKDIFFIEIGQEGQRSIQHLTVQLKPSLSNFFFSFFFKKTKKKLYCHSSFGSHKARGKTE